MIDITKKALNTTFVFITWLSLSKTLIKYKL